MYNYVLYFHSNFTNTINQGLLIETTTASGGPINRIAPDENATLEKLPRIVKNDEDVKDNGNNFQDLSLSTESPKDVIVNITDPSDKPGSILTTLIDGFLLPKQPSLSSGDTESSSGDKEDNSIANLSEIDTDAVGETVGGFPVTNILSGIYNLVSSYIQPSEEDKGLLDEEPITAIPQNAINVHNMPRYVLMYIIKSIRSQLSK